MKQYVHIESILALLSIRAVAPSFSGVCVVPDLSVTADISMLQRE